MKLKSMWIRVLDVTFTSFAFFFRNKQHVKEKKLLVQYFIPPPSICMHIRTLYTYTNTHMPRFHPSIFLKPSRCLVPTPWFTFECLACIVLHIHTHTLTYTPTLVEIQSEYPCLKVNKRLLVLQRIYSDVLGERYLSQTILFAIDVVVQCAILVLELRRVFFTTFEFMCMHKKVSVHHWRKR